MHLFFVIFLSISLGGASPIQPPILVLGEIVFPYKKTAYDT